MELQNSHPMSRPREAPSSAYVFGIEAEKAELIRRTVAANATPDELKLFLYQVSRTGLDPMARQIYFQRRYNKRRHKFEMTIITGIDGYRLVADRTGQYAGNDDPIFDDEAQPRKATVTVYKIISNVRCPFTASARWDQYYPGDEQGFMWRKMPHLMLGKCAEALALRKAFPAELSGLYIKEEMEQASGEPEEPSSAKPSLVMNVENCAQSAPKEPPSKAIYKGTPEQREFLRVAFAARGLKNRDQHAVATAMQDQPLSSLSQVIEDYLHGREKAQRRQAQESKADTDKLLA